MRSRPRSTRPTSTTPQPYSATGSAHSSVSRWAIQHGDRFGPLIVANGGAVFSDERRVAFTNMSDLVSAGGMEAVVDVAVRRIFTEQHLASHPEVIAERRAVLVETDPVAFAAACRALRDMDLTDRLGVVANPTLVIAGGADQTTPPEMARELGAAILRRTRRVDGMRPLSAVGTT